MRFINLKNNYIPSIININIKNYITCFLLFFHIKNENIKLCS